MRRFLTVLTILLATALTYVHVFLPGKVERQFNVNLDHAPYVVAPEAEALHASLFVADLHSDSLLWKRNLTRRSTVGHMDVPRLKEGNVALQVFSATTKSPSGQNYDSNEADSDRITLLTVASFWPPRTWNSLYERATYQLDKLKHFADGSDLTLIRSREDMARLVAARERGEPAIGAVYLIEGAHPLEGSLDNLDRLYEQGLRIAGLTHFFDNELGGSLHGVSSEGLSAFGRSAVRRMDELSMIVDVAHASPQMVRDVLALTTRPVILSHGGVKGACDTARNFEDELMRDIARAGGLVGIGYWGAAVCDVSPSGVVASIRYAIDLLGVEHVALGSDYDGSTAVAFDAGEIAVLTDEMLDAGFSEREIRLVMGENVKRFLLDQLPSD
ncbi:MAG: membrane dipeptidase [Pseudomonadota bacterium]